MFFFRFFSFLAERIHESALLEVLRLHNELLVYFIADSEVFILQQKGEGPAKY